MSSNYRCSICTKTDHDRRHCPKRKRKKRACKVCEDMPHRRDAAPLDDFDPDDLSADAPRLDFARTCSGCGEPYIPEPPMTLWQAMRMPAKDRWAVP